MTDDPRWDDNVSITQLEEYLRLKRLNPQPQPKSSPKDALAPLDIASWDDIAVPDMEWAVRDRIPLRQVCLFSGEGAAGKSTVGLHLAAAAALGRDWLGSLPEQGPAIYIDAEDDPQVIHIRLNAVRKYYGCTFKDLSKDGLSIHSLVGEDATLAGLTKIGLVETPLYVRLLEMIRDIQPKITVLASSANVFAGSEIDRAQVQKFVSMLTRLAIDANGAVILISHPSLTGMSNGSGISGSTAWHNSVRSRLYLHAKKIEEDEDPGDIRLLECRKNQYGPPAEAIALKWQNGMFLPVGNSGNGQADFEKADRNQDVDTATMTVFHRLIHTTNIGADRTSKNHPATLFKDEPEIRDAKIQKREIIEAIDRLVAHGDIRVEEYGRQSNRHRKLVLP